MTNTFLKRRGGGGGGGGRGGGDGCGRGRRSGLWTFSSDFCWASGVSTTHRLSIRHDSPWITFMQAHTHLETQTHTHAVALSWSMRWLFDVCDAPAGLRRGPSYQRGRLQRSVHVEHMTALWPSGLQLLGSDDCNGDSSGRLCPPPPKKS